MKLEGQIALVTGASRGIGQAIALTLANAGAHVIGTATSESGVESIKKIFANEGLQGSAYVLNVTDSSSVKAFEDTLKADDHVPGILVCPGFPDIATTEVMLIILPCRDFIMPRRHIFVIL